MSNIATIILGLVQGITEFIPISSSGHLNLLQTIFGLTPSLDLNIFLNTATLFSVLIYFRNHIDYLKSNLKYIFFATLPLVLFSYAFIDHLDKIYEDRNLLPFFFLISSLIVLSTRFIATKEKNLSFSMALVVGVFQIMAVLPGISRSGITILTGLLLGLKRKDAFLFSFSLYIPASIGAIFLDIKDSSSFYYFEPIYVLTFLLTVVIGVITLKLLKNTLVNNHYYLFGLYTLLLSAYLILT